MLSSTYSGKLFPNLMVFVPIVDLQLLLCKLIKLKISKKKEG